MLIAAATMPMAAQTADFIPVKQDIFWNEATINHGAGGQAGPAVNINLNLPADVWWVANMNEKVKLVDPAGNDVPFTLYAGGEQSDFTLIYFRLFDLDKYNKDILTFTISEGAFGDTEWKSVETHDIGRTNPELKYELNVWELAGRPEKGLSYDFFPMVTGTYFQEPYDNDREEKVSEVRIDVTFPEDVYWVPGFSKQCYVLDKDGNRFDGWWPDFGGLSSDWKAMYFGIRGINKYIDADYTLVIPEALLGNELWKNNAEEGKRTNSEIRFDFNVYKLAGCPREDHTVYDFNPEVGTPEITKIKVGTHKYDAVRIVLTFDDEVAISDKLRDKCNVVDLDAVVEDPEPGSFPAQLEYTLTANALEDNPKAVEVIVRGKGINFKEAHNYRLGIWQGAFGTKEWAAEEYCEGRASQPLEIDFSTGESGVESILTDGMEEEPIYNLHGVRVNGSELPAGIYVRGGKKVVIK